MVRSPLATLLLANGPVTPASEKRRARKRSELRSEAEKRRVFASGAFLIGAEMAASKEQEKTTKGRASQKKSGGRKRSVSGNALVKERIAALLAQVESQVDKGNMRASLTDYIRLLQMQRECDEQEPRSVEVKWIEPTEADQSGG